MLCIYVKELIFSDVHWNSLPYAILYSHVFLLPRFHLAKFLRCPPKRYIARCRQETICPPAFRKLVPPRCNTPLSSFDLSILPTSLSLSSSLFPCHFSRSLRVPISLFLFLPLSIWLSCGACTISISCGYPVADSRHESRHYPAGVRRANAKRQTGSLTHSLSISLFPSSSASAYSTSLPLLLSFPLDLFVFHSLSYRLFTACALSLSRFLSSSHLSRSLPIHQKVVVPGMRLIPREYQEPSKRTEVGWAMPLSRCRWCGCYWWNRFFFLVLSRDPRARSRLFAIRNEINAITHETLRWQCSPSQWIFYALIYVHI